MHGSGPLAEGSEPVTACCRLCGGRAEAKKADHLKERPRAHVTPKGHTATINITVQGE